jgi:Methyltransferase domain
MDASPARRSPMQRLADVGSAGSLSNRLRERRHGAFDLLVRELAARGSGPVRILDVGGTNLFWEQRGWTGRDDVEIVTLNLDAEPRVHANVEPRVGDATDLGEFGDGEFDVAFSNSVIEHLRTFEAQAAMAAEVRRVARHYWVQTPNFWFPVEPHFLAPAWHWLPAGVRVAILRRRRVGWRGPCADPERAREMVAEIRLMRRRELAQLFPEATIASERIGPMVKSLLAVKAPTPEIAAKLAG